MRNFYEIIYYIKQHWCFDGNDGVKDNDQNRTRRLIWSFQASDNPKMIMMKFMMMLMIILSFQASYSQKCKKTRQGEIFGQVFHQIIKENLQTPSWGNFPKSSKKSSKKIFLQMTEHRIRERREREGIIFFIFMFIIIIITIINTLTRERREREGSKERLEADSRAVMVWVLGLWVMTWSSLRGSYGLSPYSYFSHCLSHGLDFSHA